MNKPRQLILGLFGLLMLVGFLAPQTYAQAYGTQKHYTHAKEVLEQQYPEFLTAFQTLQEEVKITKSTDKQAQFEILMRFLPYIDNMADLTAFDTWDRWEGSWTLQREVLFTFFSIHLPTADKGHHITVFNMFVDIVFLDGVGSENIRLLTEDEIMEKRNMSREDAHYILNVWDKLHRDWPW